MDDTFSDPFSLVFCNSTLPHWELTVRLTLFDDRGNEITPLLNLQTAFPSDSYPGSRHISKFDHYDSSDFPVIKS